MDMNVVFYPAICIAIYEQGAIEAKEVAIKGEAWANVVRLDAKIAAFDEALRRTIVALTQQYCSDQESKDVSWLWIRERARELLAETCRDKWAGTGDVARACAMAQEAANISHG